MTRVSEDFRSRAAALWADAQANGRRLAACAGHQFVPVDPSRVAFAARYRCLNCQGDVDSHAVHWYLAGRAHEAAQATEA